MKIVKEDKIQKWLEKDYQKLINLIQNTDIFYKLETNQIPYFSIDYLIKQKVAKSAKYVYDLLDDVDLVIANKNISLEKSEGLYPDLLLFSPDTSTFFIVEIKRGNKTERETITELLAYEHELKNLFPYLSSFEVCFVIIASDYNTLLSHSIYSLSIWQNKNVLPIKIDGIESENYEDWNLSLHLPQAWSLLSQESFNAENIFTVNLVLEDKDAYNGKGVDVKNKDDNLEILYRGMELIVKDAERNGVNGFVLLNRLTSSPLANWCITIGVINPFKFYKFTDYDSKIKDFFDKEYSLEFIPKCVTEIATKSKKYLDIFYRVYFENFVDWRGQKRNLRDITIPINIDFFGQVDDIVNNFILNKEVRDYYYPEINSQNIDWKKAEIGLNILDNILQENIFLDGYFDFQSFYKFGTYIGIIYQYFNILKTNEPLFDNEAFIGKLRWVEIEFINAYRELLLFKKSDNFPVYKSITKENIDEAIYNIEKIINYFIDEYIDIDDIKSAFILGLEIKNYFVDNKKFMHEDEVKYIEDTIVSYSNDFVENFINKEYKEDKELLNDELDFLIKEFNYILENNHFSDSKDEQLISIFEEYTIKIISMITPMLENNSVKFNFDDLDINMLKELYIEEYKKSNDVIVLLKQNGDIKIANDKMIGMFSINPELELLFRKDMNFAVTSKIKWEELKEHNLDFDDKVNFADFYNSFKNKITKST